VNCTPIEFDIACKTIPLSSSCKNYKEYKILKINHAFWDDQPVPKMNDEVTDTGPIETKEVSDLMRRWLFSALLQQGSWALEKA